MSHAPILEQAENLLLELLGDALVPGVLHTRDSIQLCQPNGEQDYRLGVFPYDIEEARPYGTPVPVRISDTQRRSPSRAFSLRFLVFANRKAPFDSMTVTDEMILLEAVMRAIHNSCPAELEGETVSIRFDAITRQEKAALWQSLGAPLQAAIYLIMEPLVVLSTRLERFVPVRQVELKSQKKEGEIPV